jgi:hypothetical protein
MTDEEWFAQVVPALLSGMLPPATDSLRRIIAAGGLIIATLAAACRCLCGYGMHVAEMPVGI